MALEIRVIRYTAGDRMPAQDNHGDEFGALCSAQYRQNGRVRSDAG